MSHPTPPAPSDKHTLRLLLGHFTTALLTAIGLAFVWCVLLFFLMSIAESIAGSSTEQTWRRLMLMRDGTPVMRSQVDGEFQNEDAAGKQYPDLTDQDFRHLIPLLPEALIKSQRSASPLIQICSWRDQERPPNNFYFVQNLDRPEFGFVEIYDSYSKRRSGFIGSKGFQTARPGLDEQVQLKTRLLPNASSGEIRSWGGTEPSSGSAALVLLITPTGIDQINTAERTITRVVDDPDAIDVQFGRKDSEATFDDVTIKREILDPERLLIRHVDRVIQRHLKTESIQEWPLPTEYAKLANEFLVLNDETLVAVIQWRWVSSLKVSVPGIENRTGYTVGHFEKTTGKLIREINFPDNQPEQDSWAETAMSLLSGFPAMAAASLIGNHPTTSGYIAFAIYSAAVILVASLLALRFARKRGVRIPWYWYSLFLLLGIPGYFGFRWHQRWPPTRIPLAPKPTGIEILIPAGA